MPLDQYTGLMADQYLGYDAVSLRVGIGVPTLRKYLSQARAKRRAGVHSLADFPEPDTIVANSPGWRPATIDRWVKHRTGRGVGGAAVREYNKRARGA